MTALMQPPFIAAMIIPTGTGATIGGFAGDATPYMNLLASVSDVLITHPNVANAAVFQKLPENALYVEGYGLDQFMQGNWALRPVRSNRIGVVFDASITPDMLTLHLNTINAAKTVYGLDIVGYVITDEPIKTTCEMTPSGCSTGQLENPAVLLAACARLLEKSATAIALCTQLPELSVDSCKPEDTPKDINLAETESSPAEDFASDTTTVDTLPARSELVETVLESMLQVFTRPEFAALQGDLQEKGLLPESLESEQMDSSDAQSDEVHAETDLTASDGSELPQTSEKSPEKGSDSVHDSSNKPLDPLVSEHADPEADYRHGQGVDPIGGIEGILSHLIVSELGVPCAHAPVFPWETACPVTNEVINPRAAAEFIAPTFLPCVLTGLSRAPQMLTMLQSHPLDMTVNQVSALVVPANALGGPPVLAALEHGIPVLAVENNRTVLAMERDYLQSAPAHRRRLIIPVASYEEAAGYLQMMRLGLVANTEPVFDLDKAPDDESTLQTDESNAPEFPYR